MQLNNIGIAEGANIRPVRYLPTDLCATGSSGWTRNAGRSCRRMLLAPLSGRSGAGFGSILRVESDYYTKVQFLTSFVAASFTRVQLWRLPTGGIQGARNPSFWVTHAWHRGSHEAEVRSF